MKVILITETVQQQIFEYLIIIINIYILFIFLKYTLFQLLQLFSGQVKNIPISPQNQFLYYNLLQVCRQNITIQVNLSLDNQNNAMHQVKKNRNKKNCA